MFNVVECVHWMNCIAVECLYFTVKIDWRLPALSFHLRFRIFPAFLMEILSLAFLPHFFHFSPLLLFFCWVCGLILGNMFARPIRTAVLFTVPIAIPIAIPSAFLMPPRTSIRRVVSVCWYVSFINEFHWSSILPPSHRTRCCSYWNFSTADGPLASRMSLQRINNKWLCQSVYLSFCLFICVRQLTIGIFKNNW